MTPADDWKPHDGDNSPQVDGPAAPPYAVGYGKPPLEHRFTKGHSGNPRGRPRGKRTKLPTERKLQALIKKVAYRSIRINEGGEQISVPMVEAVVRSIAINAAKGQPRAQQLFTELLNVAEKESGKRRKHVSWGAMLQLGATVDPDEASKTYQAMITGKR